MSTGITDQVRNILQKYIHEHHGGVTRRAALALGFKDSSLLTQWLNGTRTPSLAVLAPVLDQLGIHLEGPGLDMESFALVPKVEAKAGAGSSLLTSGEVEGRYAFRRPFLNRIGINEKAAVLMEVMGSSMEPLIRNGDTILVDESAQEPRDNQIFLIGLDDELMVKRLQKIPGGWNIHSENPGVPDVAVTGPALDSLRIYGRVRWFGRVL